METGLSSNAAPALPGFRAILTAAALLLAMPLAAQSDSGVTSPPAPPAAEQPERPRINVLVTVPRGEVNQAQAQECENRADASTISGEIVVCRNVGDDGKNNLSESREAAQRRYAQETMLKGAPRAPEAFGIPDNGKGIGFGKAPPPAYIVDFQALPTAPAGSDADRIARGLAPLGKDGELSEEEERARREAAGIKTTVPARPKKKG
jgi:hypothetical protein